MAPCVRRMLVVAFAALVAQAALVARCAEGKPAPRSRERFIRALHEVIPGRSADQVRELLGEPDLVVVAQRRDSAPDVAHVWLYGAKQEADLPTLGRVYLTARDRVHATVGLGPRPNPDAFEEVALDELMRALNADRLAMTPKYDPRAMIRALNRLRPLTELQLQTALREFIRVLSGDELHASRAVIDGLSKLTFESKPTKEPITFNPMGDLYWMSLLQQREEFPVLPFVLVDTIPLFARTSSGSGDHRQLWDFLRHQQTHFHVNTERIAPPARPEELLDALLKSAVLVGPDAPPNEPDFILEPSGRDHTASLVVRQLLRLVETDFQPDADTLADLKSSDRARLINGIDKVRTALSEREWRWDETQCEYRVR